MTSCTSIEYIVKPLPLPPEMPQEERLTNEDLQCLTDEAYKKVVKLDQRRKTLKGIIESTHELEGNRATY